MPQVSCVPQGAGITRLCRSQQLLTPPSDIALTKTSRSGRTDTTTGGEVSQLQWFLYTQKYLDPYALTGVFDSQTRTALINFQTHNHLIDPSNPDPAAVGVVGPATRALIHLADRSRKRSAATAAFADGWLWNRTRATRSRSSSCGCTSIFSGRAQCAGAAVGMTLLLVVARTLGLLDLFLLWRWRYRSAATASESTSAACPSLSPRTTNRKISRRPLRASSRAPTIRAK